MSDFSHYSDGLRHGWQDSAKHIRTILDQDLPDAEKLTRIGWAVDAPPIGVDSSKHTCPGCGATVIGHERCGDPTRPGCQPAEPRHIVRAASEARALSKGDSKCAS